MGRTVARLRLAKRYPNSALRVRLQTGPASCYNLGIRPPVDVTMEPPSSGDSFIRVTFNEPVSLRGLPAWPQDGGALPISLDLDGWPTVVINYASSFTTFIIVPFQDLWARNQAGGYVQQQIINAV